MVPVSNPWKTSRAANEKLDAPMKKTAAGCLVLSLVLPLVCCGPALAGPKKAAVKAAAENAAQAKSSAEAVAAAALASTTEGHVLHAAWVKAGYRFTPEVKAAYLAFAKAQALRELAAAGKTLPPDFLAWIDSDPVVAATVYGARIAPAKVLPVLRSLEIDLGTDAVRKKYTQLALAMAVVHAETGPQANLAPRAPLKLAILPCPLKPVNTKESGRALDLNDHIINFLNEHFIEDVPADRKWMKEMQELVYDSNGVALPNAATTATNVATAKVKRSLTAADVMASAALQKEFNAYMLAHGQTVQINCGDHVIFPDRHEAVGKAEGKPILEAFHLFKTAYEAKGLLPPERDPAPTPAESCAFLIRNNECPTSAPVTKKKLPVCPLTAPWPILTLLAADTQPLREREDIWTRYHDRGELHTYGEYIGGIAQQFDFQSARRLSPYPFSYGTFQMMLKDGGVCGTMANMGVRTYETLGIPSCTAGQPGHCALILFERDAKHGGYECKGGQFATGGPEKTHPHTPWCFGDVDVRKDMVYYQSIAWAINAGFQSYLDSTLACDLFRLLPEADRKAHGQDLLESALALNPFNFLLPDIAIATAATPQSEIKFWKAFKAALAAGGNKPGCPADSLYNETVRGKMFASLVKLPVPTDKPAAREMYTFLQAEKCDNAEALAVYQIALEGLHSLLAKTEAAFKAHLASARTEAACDLMAGEITAAAVKISDKPQKLQWVSARWQEMQGHELFFNPKGNIITDATAPALAKLNGKKLAAAAALAQPLMNVVAAELKTSVAGAREPKTCRQIAAEISAVVTELANPTQTRPWLEALAKIIAGHEQFTPKNAKKNAKPQRDPCADTIAQLRAASTGGK